MDIGSAPINQISRRSIKIGSFAPTQIAMDGLLVSTPQSFSPCRIYLDKISNRFESTNNGGSGCLTSSSSQIEISASGKHSKKIPLKTVTSIVDGLKKLYIQKLKPLESIHRFHEFVSPALTNSDFDAKPMVMLLGQYSTGKTTFIKHLLRSGYPGAHIGPEPTTDRFVAVMNGTDERSIPGNTVAVQADMPFNGLTTFGSAFLSKFQCSQMAHPLLEHITFVDTPGVLSGEKQRTQRSYDFTGVTSWFAAKCDRILLLFDPHKLDISDEFKRVISSLKGHDDKIRVVLNKAHQVDTQQINEFVKRARAAKIHAYIMNQLKKEMPSWIGKAKAQQRLIDNLDTLFEKIQREHHLPPGDFPNVDSFRLALNGYNIDRFERVKSRMIQAVDDMLAYDIPNLLKTFRNPYE
ncbi:hypothetical protein L1987_19840 [Smallanthus sonchifolius]|uniref:Uncharacterized protein n=1 Tax=Smallanthus sonchifolius TaxID=185202 RepID=A0ACB9IQL3_9ASTR|nr:hypothetical protein L1987_19840 [Smallanthus sonchifolius]